MSREELLVGSMAAISLAIGICVIALWQYCNRVHRYTMRMRKDGREVLLDIRRVLDMHLGAINELERVDSALSRDGADMRSAMVVLSRKLKEIEEHTTQPVREVSR